MHSSSSSYEEDTLLVLYGSQTGNAQQAAEDFCDQCRARQISCLLSTLDDWLEVHHGRLTRRLVIFVSSYGHGGPPLGCYRFRDLCDHWLQQEEDTSPFVSWSGVRYALCGLGDSKYPTYFRNPTVIDDALQKVGAQRVGPIGRANATVKAGAPSQEQVIADWVAGIWEPLLEKPMPLSTSETPDWRGLQRDLMRQCREIIPDFVGPEDEMSPRPRHILPWMMMSVSSIAVAVLSVLLYYNYQQQQQHYS